MVLELKAANTRVASNGEATHYEVTGLPESHVAVIRQTPRDPSWQVRGTSWQYLHWTSQQPECDWTGDYDSKEAALAALRTALAE